MIWRLFVMMTLQPVETLIVADPRMKPTVLVVPRHGRSRFDYLFRKRSAEIAGLAAEETQPLLWIYVFEEGGSCAVHGNPAAYLGVIGSRKRSG